MKEILNSLSKHPVKTKVSLSGKLIVARDTAHAKLLERLNSGGGLPNYFKENAVYYAGPQKHLKDMLLDPLAYNCWTDG